MSEMMNETGGAGPSHRSVEIGVGVVIGFLGLISVYGGMQVGMGWGVDGPEAGFFPFYVGLIIVLSSVVNVWQTVKGDAEGESFASWQQLRQVLSVFVPTAVYVFLIAQIGMYVASALLIAFFMIWMGGYRWFVAVPIAIVVPVLTFVTFEIWFLVPLPKGPLEAALGF